MKKEEKRNMKVDEKFIINLKILISKMVIKDYSFFAQKTKILKF